MKLHIISWCDPKPEAVRSALTPILDLLEITQATGAMVYIGPATFGPGLMVSDLWLLIGGRHVHYLNVHGAGYLQSNHVTGPDADNARDCIQRGTDVPIYDPTAAILNMQRTRP